MTRTEISIKAYNREELQAFISSEDYRMQETVPISYRRAISQINNPRLDANDLILFLAWKGNKVVAFRNVLPDFIFNGEVRVKVAWISGTWVHPDFRRQGLAKRLFKIMYESWGGSLVFTNYAPVSKKIYDATSLFQTYADHSGSRFYLRSDFQNLIPARFPFLNWSKPLIKVGDALLNTGLRLFIKRPSRSSYNTLKEVESLTSSQIDLLMGSSLTNRGELEFKWIREYPWVVDRSHAGKDEQPYPFSSVASPFKQIIGQSSDGNVICLLNVKGRQMRIPYYYAEVASMPLMTEFILRQAQLYKVAIIDVYDQKLIKALKNSKRSYFMTKRQEWKYMADKDLFNRLPKSSEVHIPDGEGEVVFI